MNAHLCFCCQHNLLLLNTNILFHFIVTCNYDDIVADFSVFSVFLFIPLLLDIKQWGFRQMLNG